MCEDVFETVLIVLCQAIAAHVQGSDSHQLLSGPECPYLQREGQCLEMVSTAKQGSIVAPFSPALSLGTSSAPCSSPGDWQCGANT